MKREKVKRAGQSILVIGMTLALLAGCGNKAGDSGKEQDGAAESISVICPRQELDTDGVVEKKSGNLRRKQGLKSI